MRICYPLRPENWELWIPTKPSCLIPINANCFIDPKENPYP